MKPTGPSIAVCRSAVAIAVLLMAAGGVALSGQLDGAKGELKIEGTHITKLVLGPLDGSSRGGEWASLSGSITLPAGTYRIDQIELQGGYAMSSSADSGDLTRIVVSPDKPAVLKAGGPLRQVIQVSRHGSVLTLNYELAGIGGEKYTGATTQSPPSFTIYKGNRAIGSGQFEYG
jgi:hypothetical protein